MPNIAELARAAGLEAGTVHARLRRGASLEDALKKPVKPKPPDGQKQCPRCGRVLPKNSFSILKRRGGESLVRCKDCETARSRERKQAMRLDILRKYCGEREPACEMCGESDAVVLSIDHKNCDGNTDRRSHPSTYAYFASLRDGPVREDLRVLCRNCNWRELIRYNKQKKP